MQRGDRLFVVFFVAVMVEPMHDGNLKKSCVFSWRLHGLLILIYIMIDILLFSVHCVHAVSASHLFSTQRSRGGLWCGPREVPGPGERPPDLPQCVPAVEAAEVGHQRLAVMWRESDENQSRSWRHRKFQIVICYQDLFPFLFKLFSQFVFIL